MTKIFRSDSDKNKNSKNGVYLKLQSSYVIKRLKPVRG